MVVPFLSERPLGGSGSSGKGDKGDTGGLRGAVGLRHHLRASGPQPPAAALVFRSNSFMSRRALPCTGQSLVQASETQNRRRLFLGKRHRHFRQQMHTKSRSGEASPIQGLAYWYRCTECCKVIVVKALCRPVVEQLHGREATPRLGAAAQGTSLAPSKKCGEPEDVAVPGGPLQGR